jgi:hypothetical protein
MFGGLRVRTALPIVTTLVLLLATTTASLAQNPSLNWGSEVNPARCPTDQGYRYLEINVTRKVEADFAPGAGNFDADQIAPMSPDGWAEREFNQHIQVWKVGVIVDPPPGGERFCALVRYQSSFVSTGTSNPAATGCRPASREPSRVATDWCSPPRRTSRHQPAATWKRSRCPVASPTWISQYFTSISTTVPEWWGWVYHGGHNGTWVNSIGPNVQGNITGTP